MRRYPSAPVVAYLRSISTPDSTAAGVAGTYRQRVDALGEAIGRSQLRHSLAREGDFSEAEADQVATALEMHPRELWPEWDRIDPTEGRRPCANEECDSLFIPNNNTHAYCTPSCKKRANGRLRYRRHTERLRAERRAHYETHKEQTRLTRKRYSIRTGEADRFRERYQNDPEFREKVKARVAARAARLRAERQDNGEAA